LGGFLAPEVRNARGGGPWREGGAVVGYTRQEGNLAQVLVANAGHLVPMDQPKVALAMLDRFLTGQGFDEGQGIDVS
jgi:carboxypeptidase C (cathepsin A)